MAPEQTPSSAHDQQPFRFMDLPPELRIRVYGELLATEKGILLLAGRDGQLVRMYKAVGAVKAVGVADRQIVTTGILTTCKLVHKEATPALYANNTFLSYQLDEVFPRFHAQIQGSWKLLRALQTDNFPRSKEKFHNLLHKLKEAKHLENLIITDCYRLQTASNVLDKYPTPEAFAKEVEPFVQELHKRQKKDQERKPRNVVGVLQFRLARSTAQVLRHTNVEVVKRAQKKYEADVKAILARTLK